ncbi:unnamed protein product [Coffea canephora]|uniref:Uncharacterized protein n=1 Tax=Coffea canephora TaxID=49390 RepID=A0A068TUP8_COFCA|nr:unnamed protein product [Coffea canephora]
MQPNDLANTAVRWPLPRNDLTTFQVPLLFPLSAAAAAFPPLLTTAFPPSFTCVGGDMVVLVVERRPCLSLIALSSISGLNLTGPNMNILLLDFFDMEVKPDMFTFWTR